LSIQIAADLVKEPFVRCNVLSHREGSSGPPRGNGRRKKITRDNLDRRIKKTIKMTKRWKKYSSPAALRI